MHVNAFKKMHDILCIEHEGGYMYLKRIKDLREDHDKYQKEIADVLGITRQQYSLYELGDREFKLEHIKKLAEYYQTSTDYLLELTDIKEPYKKRDLKQ